MMVSKIINSMVDKMVVDILKRRDTMITVLMILEVRTTTITLEEEMDSTMTETGDNSKMTFMEE